MKNVLVIDSDKEILESVELMLDGVCKVFKAKSLFEAVRMLTSAAPDVVMVDYEMLLEEKDSGILDMLRGSENQKRIPIFFMSDIDDRQTVIEALGMKPDCYILKH